VLLRFINSSAMSAYHVDLGALTGELIAVDGFRVQRRFPVAVAQRLDIRVRIPKNRGVAPNPRDPGG
jgi:FtsP/CotA-like multicopper oxidase with cupredoxin domain